MKNSALLLFMSVATVFVSCSDEVDDAGEKEYLIAVPVTSDLQQFKEEAVAVTDPLPIKESGKIYAYKDYVFVNDVNRGFHILDNSDPAAPENIAFIKLEGNNDISVKDDRLYADSYGDLVIFDIADIENIPAAKRIENAIYQQFWCTVGFDVDWPEADYFDYSEFDPASEAIIGWEVKTESLSEEEFGDRFGYPEDTWAREAFNADTAGSEATVGQGGSLARFKIVGDYLYAVDWSSISIFDISDLDDPKVLDDVYTTGQIETIYNQGDILFLGGPQGMYIYDIGEPAKPTMVGEFVHGTACDPVVVDGDIAFVTLRGENSCGGTESGLYVVDLSDLAKPELRKFYPLEGPYGLGFKGDKLFICDGTAGLKVYDKSDVNDLQLLNQFEDIVTYDVIPLEHSLLMIGDKILYQYEYLEEDIRLISSFDLK